jgi:hypothetical protein
VTLPAGTRLMVRLNDNISSASARAGSRFAVKLDAPAAASGFLVLPRGTDIYGVVVAAQKAGRLARRAKLVVTLSEISHKGRMIRIVTNQAGAEGGRSGTVAKVGAATIVGAAFGGGSGAGKGAAVGGAVALLTPGKQIRVPRGSLVEFTLKQAVVIP